MGRAARNAPDADAVAFLPLVGAVIGALAGGLGWGIVRVFGPTPEYALLAHLATFVAVILLSGAIHVDGFLDSCDALFAPVNLSRRLEIFKDPRHGTFAVVGMALLTLLWWSLIQAFAPAGLGYVLIFAFSGACARLAMLGNAWFFGNPPAAGTRRTFSSRPNAILWIAQVVLAVGLALAIDRSAALLIPGAIAMALLIGAWASRKLDGGLVGDVYGFGIVLIEVAVLVGIVAMR